MEHMGIYTFVSVMWNKSPNWYDIQSPKPANLIRLLTKVFSKGPLGPTFSRSHGGHGTTMRSIRDFTEVGTVTTAAPELLAYGKIHGKFRRILDEYREDRENDRKNVGVGHKNHCQPCVYIYNYIQLYIYIYNYVISCIYDYMHTLWDSEYLII